MVPCNSVRPFFFEKCRTFQTTHYVFIFLDFKASWWFHVAPFAHSPLRTVVSTSFWNNFKSEWGTAVSIRRIGESHGWGESLIIYTLYLGIAFRHKIRLKLIKWSIYLMFNPQDPLITNGLRSDSKPINFQTSSAHWVLTYSSKRQSIHFKLIKVMPHHIRSYH